MVCKKCNKEKLLDGFSKNKKVCKTCIATATRNRRHLSGENSPREFRCPKEVFVRNLYNTQRASSAKREHSFPEYTAEELWQLLRYDWVFDNMFKNYVNLGYRKSMAPSIDRIDDSISYVLSNLQLMTWQENKDKGSYDRRVRSNTAVDKGTKVLQSNKNGVEIAQFNSATEATLITGVHRTNIVGCCSGKRNSAGGFLWEYV